MDSIYLDHNATTPLLPEVAAAMADCWRRGLANAGSQHAPGRRARHTLEAAREVIAGLLGANLSGPQPDRLIFCSGGSEANNLAILGQSAATSGRWITSGIEHPSVAAPLEHLASRGWTIETLPTTQIGQVDIAPFPQTSPQLPTLATVMLGNNETGVLQPLAELAARARGAGIPLHTDAVQVVGKLPVDFRGLGVASLSFTAHKFHGPRGIGGLLVRHDVQLQPQLFGGFQQAGLRPGTESVELVVGMLTALEIWQRDRQQRIEQMSQLRDRLAARLVAAWPSATINGLNAPRLPHCLNIAFPGIDRQALVMALDLAGVANSTGSACASGSSQPSHVLLAMHLPTEIVASSLRFSLGATTTAADIDTAAGRIAGVLKNLAR